MTKFFHDFVNRYSRIFVTEASQHPSKNEGLGLVAAMGKCKSDVKIG